MALATTKIDQIGKDLEAKLEELAQLKHKHKKDGLSAGQKKFCSTNGLDNPEMPVTKAQFAVKVFEFASKSTNGPEILASCQALGVSNVGNIRELSTDDVLKIAEKFKHALDSHNQSQAQAAPPASDAIDNTSLAPVAVSANKFDSGVGVNNASAASGPKVVDMPALETPVLAHVAQIDERGRLVASGTGSTPSRAVSKQVSFVDDKSDSDHDDAQRFAASSPILSVRDVLDADKEDMAEPITEEDTRAYADQLSVYEFSDDEDASEKRPDLILKPKDDDAREENKMRQTISDLIQHMSPELIDRCVGLSDGDDIFQIKSDLKKLFADLLNHVGSSATLTLDESAERLRHFVNDDSVGNKYTENTDQVFKDFLEQVKNSKTKTFMPPLRHGVKEEQGLVDFFAPEGEGKPVDKDVRETAQDGYVGADAAYANVLSKPQDRADQSGRSALLAIIGEFDPLAPSFSSTIDSGDKDEAIDKAAPVLSSSGVSSTSGAVSDEDGEDAGAADALPNSLSFVNDASEVDAVAARLVQAALTKAAADAPVTAAADASAAAKKMKIEFVINTFTPDQRAYFAVLPVGKEAEKKFGKQLSDALMSANHEFMEYAHLAKAASEPDAHLLFRVAKVMEKGRRFLKENEKEKLVKFIQAVADATTPAWPEVSDARDAVDGVADNAAEVNAAAGIVASDAGEPDQDNELHAKEAIHIATLLMTNPSIDADGREAFITTNLTAENYQVLLEGMVKDNDDGIAAELKKVLTTYFVTLDSALTLQLALLVQPSPEKIAEAEERIASLLAVCKDPRTSDQQRDDLIKFDFKESATVRDNIFKILSPVNANIEDQRYLFNLVLHSITSIADAELLQARLAQYQSKKNQLYDDFKSHSADSVVYGDIVNALAVPDNLAEPQNSDALLAMETDKALAAAIEVGKELLVLAKERKLDSEGCKAFLDVDKLEDQHAIHLADNLFHKDFNPPRAYNELVRTFHLAGIKCLQVFLKRNDLLRNALTRSVGDLPAVMGLDAIINRVAAALKADNYDAAHNDLFMAITALEETGILDENLKRIQSIIAKSFANLDDDDVAILREVAARLTKSQGLKLKYEAGAKLLQVLSLEQFGKALLDNSATANTLRRIITKDSTNNKSLDNGFKNIVHSKLKDLVDNGSELDSGLKDVMALCAPTSSESSDFSGEAQASVTKLIDQLRSLLHTPPGEYESVTALGSKGEPIYEAVHDVVDLEAVPVVPVVAAAADTVDAPALAGGVTVTATIGLSNLLAAAPAPAVPAAASATTTAVPAPVVIPAAEPTTTPAPAPVPRAATDVARSLAPEVTHERPGMAAPKATPRPAAALATTKVPAAEPAAAEASPDAAAATATPAPAPEPAPAVVSAQVTVDHFVKSLTPGNLTYFAAGIPQDSGDKEFGDRLVEALDAFSNDNSNGKALGQDLNDLRAAAAAMKDGQVSKDQRSAIDGFIASALGRQEALTSGAATKTAAAHVLNDAFNFSKVFGNNNDKFFYSVGDIRDVGGKKTVDVVTWKDAVKKDARGEDATITEQNAEALEVKSTEAGVVKTIVAIYLIAHKNNSAAFNNPFSVNVNNLQLRDGAGKDLPAEQKQQIQKLLDVEFAKFQTEFPNYKATTYAAETAPGFVTKGRSGAASATAADTAATGVPLGSNSASTFAHTHTQHRDGGDADERVNNTRGFGDGQG